MNKKILFLSGPAAVFLYAATVIVGAAMNPGYSHINNAISELFSPGAPNKAAIDIAFDVYNLLLILFSAAICLAALKEGKKQVVISGAALFITAISGLLMNLFFPMDPMGTPATLPGIIHIVLAGIASLLTMVSMGFAAAGAQERGYRIYTIVSLVIVFISGGTAGYMASQAHPLMGLLERVTIGAFLQWLVVSGIRMKV